jgi:hypothetical protein
MTMANGGTFPRFSKYSGVAPWADGYFLWINIDINPQTGRSQNEYPNVFLDGGRRVTWFGGSSMHPESAVVRGLLRAGGREEGGGGGEHTPSSASVVIFVREVKQPYSCFGRAQIDEVDLSKRPIRVTWRLLDFPSLLAGSAHFSRIVGMAS